MDTKIAYLRRLTADAERVLGELTRAIAGAEARLGRGPAGSPAAAPAAAGDGGGTPGTGESVDAEAEALAASPVPGVRQDTASVSAGVLAVTPEPAPEPPRPAHGPIDIVIGGGGEVVPAPAAGDGVPPPAPAGEEPIRDRIIRLAAEGKPKEAIAEAVGLPKGEVELVLSLDRASRGLGGKTKGRARRG